MKKYKENKKNIEKTVVTVDSEKKSGIKIIDEEGYDIEQFLCRCGNKTSSTVF